MNSMIVLLVGVTFCLVLLATAYFCSFSKAQDGSMALNLPLARGLIVVQAVEFAAFSTSILAWIADEMTCSYESFQQRQCVELGFHHSSKYLLTATVLGVIMILCGCFLSTLLLAYPALSSRYFASNHSHSNDKTQWRGVAAVCFLCAVCSSLVLVFLALESNSSSSGGGSTFHNGAYCVMLSIALYLISSMILWMLAPRMHMLRQDDTVGTPSPLVWGDNNEEEWERGVDHGNFDAVHHGTVVALESSRDEMRSTAITNMADNNTSNIESPQENASFDSTTRFLIALSFLLYLLHVAGSTTLLVLHNEANNNSNNNKNWVTNLVGGVWMLLLVPYHSYGARYYHYNHGVSSSTCTEQEAQSSHRRDCSTRMRIPITDAKQVLKINLCVHGSLGVVAGVLLGVLL